MDEQELDLLKKLDYTVAIIHYGKQFMVVGKCRDVEEMRDLVDKDEEVMPYIVVIELHDHNGNNGMWLERELYLDELLADPSLRLFTLREIDLETD